MALTYSINDDAGEIKNYEKGEKKKRSFYYEQKYKKVESWKQKDQDGFAAAGAVVNAFLPGSSGRGAGVQSGETASFFVTSADKS